MREKLKPGEPKIPDAASQNPEHNIATGDQLSDLVVAGNFDAIPDDATTNEALAAPEMKDAVRVAIGTACREMNMERLGTILERCKPSDTEYIEALTDAFVGALNADAALGARMLMWVKDYRGSFTSKVLDAASNAVIRSLKEERIDVAADILESLQYVSTKQSDDDITSSHLPILERLKSFFSSENGAILKKAALSGLVKQDQITRFTRFMTSSDAAEVSAKVEMQECLNQGCISDYEYLKSKYGDIPHEEVEQMCCRAILEMIRDGRIGQAQYLAINRRISNLLPMGFMSSSEVFDAVTKRISVLLEAGDIDGAGAVLQKVHVPREYLTKCAKEAVTRMLSMGKYEDAFETVSTMRLDAKEITISEETKPALLRLLQDGDINVIARFNRFFEVPDEICTKPEIQGAALQMLEGNFSDRMSFQDVRYLIKQFKLSKALTTADTKKSAIQLIAEKISSPDITSIPAFADFFDLSQEDVRVAAQKGMRYLLLHNENEYEPDLQAARKIVHDFALPEQSVQDIVTDLFHSGYTERALRIMNIINIPSEAMSNTLDDLEQQDALQEILQVGENALLLKFVEIFHPSKEVILAPLVHEAALVMVEKMMGSRLDVAIAAAERLALDDEELKLIGYRILYKMLAESRAMETFTLIKKLHLSKEDAVKILGAYHPVLIFFDDTVPQPIRYAAETYVEGVTFEHQRSRLTHRVGPDEYRRIIEQNPALREDANPERIFDALLELPQEGGEGAEITKAMQVFAEVVGKETALRFANRPDLSRHDAFMSANELRKFIEINNIAEEGQDRKNLCELLAQVARDDRGYETGTANHEWNRVIRQLAYAPVETIIAEAETAGIPGLQERIDKLRTDRFSPFRSWRGLRDCVEIASLLERRELLEIFAAGTLPPKVQAFGETLLQHPTIDLEALTQLLLRPEEFVSRSATYADEDRQQKMSPANLMNQHRLPLSAEELRDTLVDGRFDALQELAPHEATFFLDQEGQNTETEAYLRTAFLSAIGQQKHGIKGKATNPRALFHTLRQFGTTIQRDMHAWLQSPSSTDAALSTQQLKELRTILHGESGVKLPITHKVRVRLGKKNDANVLAAMNDAASCMPFGDGKTNVYLWNPNCAFLVVERHTEEGWRTMAQSVVMKDMDIGRSAKEAIDRLKIATPVHDVLGAESLAGMLVLTCDNIEPSASEISAGRIGLIEHAYRAFLPEYLRAHAADMGVDPTRVVIGKETYDTRRPAWGFETITNTFLPAAPISYSDNSGTESYMLRTGLPSPEVSSGARGGVSPVRTSDALALAYAEGRSFDNAAMIVGLYKIQHRIVGQALNQEIHGDPNLSFISRTKDGKPAGYILAGLDRGQEKPEVYIADFAVDQSLGATSARHAVKILDTFLEAFMEHWKDGEGDIPSIFAEMREKTSYKLLQRQGEKLAKKFGLTIRTSEEGTSTKGEETIHHVRISIDR